MLNPSWPIHEPARLALGYFDLYFSRACMNFPLRKLAAIDIGSNAVRCQISAVLYYEGRYRLKRVEYVRFPMRLGEDVFASGQISPAKERSLSSFCTRCKLLMEVHDVAHYLICATSAMRSAANGAGHCRPRAASELGMEIKVIDGQDEAFYINRVIEHVLEDNKHYLHIDVGGGSTEFNIYHDRRKVAAQSFEIGSIRRMQQEESGEPTPRPGRALGPHGSLGARTTPASYHVTRAIGTGGNINKIYSLSPAAPEQARHPAQHRQHPHRLAGLSMERAGERGHAQPRPRRRHRARRPHLPLGHGMGQHQQHARARHRPERRHAAGPVRRLLRRELSPDAGHPAQLPVPDVQNRPAEME